MVAIEARAAAIYWKLWEDVAVRFARRNPERLGQRPMGPEPARSLTPLRSPSVALNRQAVPRDDTGK